MYHDKNTKPVEPFLQVTISSFLEKIVKHFT